MSDLAEQATCIFRTVVVLAIYSIIVKLLIIGNSQNELLSTTDLGWLAVFVMVLILCTGLVSLVNTNNCNTLLIVQLVLAGVSLLVFTVLVVNSQSSVNLTYAKEIVLWRKLF